jgi:DNA repair exonuclease SbcCD nuclease subunit
MRPLTHINDVHIGAIRTGGTTPSTAYALRLATLARFDDILGWTTGSDVLINGDLFDTGSIPMMDLWTAVQLVKRRMEEDPEKIMFVARGNHDIMKNSTLLSSFDLFCNIMQSFFPERFVPITEPQAVPQGWVIPHMPNQDLFDAALGQVPAGTKYLFLHCNFDNKFAVEADHSLNLSITQAGRLEVERIVLAHEHQRREEMAGKVIIVGNQIPTSIADCLGNDAKYMLKITDKMEFVPTWKREGDFARPDWRDLPEFGHDPHFGPRFIRVEGEATAAEAAQVVAAISKFRSKSPALVITNAVTIDGVKADEDIKVSLESVKGFNVYEELLKLLSPEEAELVKQLVKENNVQTTQAD